MEREHDNCNNVKSFRLTGNTCVLDKLQTFSFIGKVNDNETKQGRYFQKSKACFIPLTVALPALATSNGKTIEKSFAAQIELIKTDGGQYKVVHKGDSPATKSITGRIISVKESNIERKRFLGPSTVNPNQSKVNNKPRPNDAVTTDTKIAQTYSLTAAPEAKSVEMAQKPSCFTSQDCKSSTTTSCTNKSVTLNKAGSSQCFSTSPMNSDLRVVTGAVKSLVTSSRIFLSDATSVTKLEPKLTSKTPPATVTSCPDSNEFFQNNSGTRNPDVESSEKDDVLMHRCCTPSFDTPGILKCMQKSTESILDIMKVKENAELEAAAELPIPETTNSSYNYAAATFSEKSDETSRPRFPSEDELAVEALLKVEFDTKIDPQPTGNPVNEINQAVISLTEKRNLSDQPGSPSKKTKRFGSSRRKVHRKKAESLESSCNSDILLDHDNLNSVLSETLGVLLGNWNR